MSQLIDALSAHDGALLFVAIFSEALGLPLPVVPVLLVAGAMAHGGAINPVLAFAVPPVALMLGDALWFYLGKWRGNTILRLLCRIAIEPDVCVRHTQDMFLKHGVKSLLIARFVPGLSTVSAPLAGLSGVAFSRFLVFDVLGALLYAGTYFGLGYLFSKEIDQVATIAAGMGSKLGLVVVLALGAYLAVKWYNRNRLLKSLRMPRMTVGELRERMATRQPVFVIDVRAAAIDPAGAEQMIPGSVRIALAEMDAHVSRIPADHDVVIYCGCPNEASAAKAALVLKRAGFKRVFPLAGGIDAWLELQEAGVTLVEPAAVIQ